MSHGLTQKWRHIADVIRSEIDRQLYRPGDQLPTVVILAERFGVNRHTVRRALDSLQQSGLVSMEQGRGTFVADTSIAHRPAERLALRLGAHPLAGLGVRSQQGGALGALPSGRLLHERLLLEKIQPTSELCALLKAPESEAFWHLRILTFLGHDPLCLSNHYLRVRRFADLDASLERGQHDVHASLAEHGFSEIGRQETNIQAIMASPDQKARLEISGNHPLLITSGLDRDLKSGELLQYVVTAWPAQRVYFVQDPANTDGSAQVSPEGLPSDAATPVGGASPRPALRSAAMA